MGGGTDDYGELIGERTIGDSNYDCHVPLSGEYIEGTLTYSIIDVNGSIGRLRIDEIGYDPELPATWSNGVTLQCAIDQSCAESSETGLNCAVWEGTDANGNELPIGTVIKFYEKHE